MCMAASFKSNNHFFGRNLDLEISFGEEVVVTPRRFPFRYRNGDVDEEHHAMIGMALVSDGYPLYFDATNEKGLSMAGLNFPDQTRYEEYSENKVNITPFEFIPWMLGKCETTVQARELIKTMNLWNESFSKELQLSPLHWMISDRDSSIVVESTESGINIYDNPVGILTNCPPFPYHLQNLSNYMNLSAGLPENRFSKELDLKAYSRGMGAIGLPGDLSSSSRFVKASFTKMNCLKGDTVEEDITQFFHIMDSVQQQKGCCDLGNGKYEYTIYTSCWDTDEGIYYYRTYDNSQINGVDMKHTDLDGEGLYKFPIVKGQHINMIDRYQMSIP